jgi:hypothetical protein
MAGFSGFFNDPWRYKNRLEAWDGSTDCIEINASRKVPKNLARAIKGI